MHGDHDPQRRLERMRAFSPKGRLFELTSSLPQPAGPLPRAEIVRQLKGSAMWHLLGVRRTKEGFSVRLVRPPDAQTGSGPFVRHHWRIMRAVVDAWLHYRAGGKDLYKLGPQDHGLLEGATTAELLASELKRMLRAFGRAGRK
jgi:hypothetical protein